jgi:signal transduction histidine kinase
VLARILLTVFQRYLVQHAARAAITSMLDGALYVVLSVALKGLPVDNGAAFVWDPDTFRFVLSVQVGMDDAMLAKFEAQRLEPDDVPQLMRAIGELQPLAVEDAQADPALLGTLAGLGNGAVVIAPFFHITQLLGILYLGRGVPYRFHAEDLLFLSNLLRQTSAAVANAVFIQELHEADAAKTMMLRMASHDLRSPLTQAYTYLELFRRTMGPLGLEQAELLTGLGKSLKRIEAMIGDVLDVEHAVAGGRWDPVNVATLVADIYAEKAPLAAVRQQKLVIELDGALPGALGDGVQLRQAVANLVDNAIKYTPPGGWIWVRARPLADQILIEVQDTGYGIALEDQSRIFEHFYRSSRDNVREVEGVGLGLSLVKAVVERHGGRVWVESEVGKGSAFRLMVPART